MSSRLCPRASGLSGQPRRPPAGAHERVKGIWVMQAWGGGGKMKGMCCGDTAQPTLLNPSLYRIWFILESKQNALAISNLLFCLLEECFSSMGRGVGGGASTSIHPGLSVWSVESAFRSAHWNGEIKSGSFLNKRSLRGALLMSVHQTLGPTHSHHWGLQMLSITSLNLLKSWHPVISD